MILVFGSINVDLLMRVPNLPRPGETVLGRDYMLLPGGKGANQALAACRAGAAVKMAGAVGSDDFARRALAALDRAGVDLSLVQRVDRPTGVAAIMVEAGGENLIAVAPGANRLAASADVRPDAVLGPQTILICQMEVPAAENWALLRRARVAGARTMLNLAPAAPIDRARFADIDILVANAAEMATFGTDPAALAGALGQAVVVTRGAAGSTAFVADGGRIETPALALENTADTTGAGDTFVGVLAAGLDQGLALAAALRRASAAAGLACQMEGAQTGAPDRAAIDEAVTWLPD